MKRLFVFICCVAISSTVYAQEAVKGGEAEAPRSASPQSASGSTVKCLKSGPGWSLSGIDQQEKFIGDNQISDEELIARLAYAESVGLDGASAPSTLLIADAKGIAETILNRSLLSAKSGKSLIEMVYKRNAYSSIQGANNKPSPDFLCPRNLPLWTAVREHAHGIYDDGSIRVLSGDATAYYKDSGKGSKPKWAVPKNQQPLKGAMGKSIKFYKVVP